MANLLETKDGDVRHVQTIQDVATEIAAGASRIVTAIDGGLVDPKALGLMTADVANLRYLAGIEGRLLFDD
jgi:hypothetical protein